MVCEQHEGEIAVDMWPCCAQIKENQLQAIMEERVKTKKKDKKGMMKEDPSNVKLMCRSCGVAVCCGEDIEIIERMHHVNVTEAFRYIYTRGRYWSSFPVRVH